MKKNNQYFLAALLTSSAALSLFSCKEIGPVIKLKDQGVGKVLIDSSWVTSSIEAPQDKVVLLEDFTGVQCSNCPNGHATAASLKAANPGRVIGVALHSYLLADPYPFSRFDLKSEKAEQINSTFGPAPAKPTGMVNRKVFAGETSKIYFISKWSSFVSSELAGTSPVNIDITNNFNESSRELEMQMKVHFTAEYTNPLRYSIYLVENEIVTAQLLPDLSKDTNYVHNDVMRDVLSSITGDNFAQNTYEKGRTYLKSFVYSIPEDLDPEHTEIVVFVHRFGGVDEVIQAAVKNIK